MNTSYGVGQYASGEAHLCVRSRQCVPGKRGILFAHSYGGNALDMIGAGGGVDLSPVNRELALLDCPIIGADLGGVRAWGNDTAQARMTNLQSFVESWFGAASEPVIVMGVSMGALLALNWARANPAQVRAIVLMYPVVNLQAQHDGTGGAGNFAAADIEWAYGGSLSAFESAAPAHDPAQNEAAYTNAFDIRAYYSTADTVAGTANQEAWFSGVGGSRLSTVALNGVTHGDMTQIPVRDLMLWLDEYL